MELYTLSVIVFAIILAVLIYKDRKNWEFSFISIRRTRKFIDVLDRIAKCCPRLWNFMAYAGIVVGVYLLITGLLIFASATMLVLQGKVKGPSGGIVVPSPSPKFEIGYGYILIPFWFFIFLLPLIVVPHELMHGVIARLERIRIKSTGILFLLFIPGGAFVEQDEKSFNKAKTLSKIKVAAAGSFANFLMFLLILSIANLSWPAVAEPHAIYLVNVTNSSPAYKAGLRAGMIITSFDNETVLTSFSAIYRPPPKRPGEIMKVTTLTNGTFYIKLDKSPDNESKGYMGISYTPYYKNPFAIELVVFLRWILLFEYWIAIFNMLPLYPLDGGLILKSILERRTKHWKRIVNITSAIILLLLLIVIFGPIIMR